MAQLTSAEMRAVELMLEQNERLVSMIKARPQTPIDIVVRDFYENGVLANFEHDILIKIGRLLSDPDEPQTYQVII